MRLTLKDNPVLEFLDATASQHDGYGGKDFEHFMKQEVSIQAIADIFGVVWATADSWVKKYKQERGSHVQENVERQA